MQHLLCSVATWSALGILPGASVAVSPQEGVPAITDRDGSSPRPPSCADAILDQATGGCLEASSVPSPGLLFPPPHDGGVGNLASGANAFVGGGRDNHATGAHSVVVAGEISSAVGTASVLGGSFLGLSLGEGSTVCGGALNGATGDGSTITSGFLNGTGGAYAAVGGGSCNRAYGDYATIPGGGEYKDGGLYADGTGSTTSGGQINRAHAAHSTVSGGLLNSTYGDASTIPGGEFNHAGGAFSFAAGRLARSTHDGTFVWGDARSAVKSSSNANEFSVFASRGARFFSNPAATTGVLLAPGAGSWTSVSDQDAKENVAPVDRREVLERLAEVPVSTWNYKAQEDSVRHMGPMAQAFRAAFGLGLGDTTIDTVDPDGVALAAIQGLNERDGELATRLSQEEGEVAALRRELAALKRTLGGGSDNTRADPTSAPGRNCAEGLIDASGGACLQASSVPTPGLLFPPPHDGGVNNDVSGPFAFLGGGVNNRAMGRSAVVVGGSDNTASAFGATLVGGSDNAATGAGSMIGGGRTNEASGYYGTVAGGLRNVAGGYGSTVGGGAHNRALGDYSTVAGGGGYPAGGNLASGEGATVGGGRYNRASDFATVGGGTFNYANARGSTIPGGSDNRASGGFSFAAGRGARAGHQGSFVWGDSRDGTKPSSAADQFNVYASGGARFFSDAAASAGVLLAPGGGSWTSVSDRAAKENVRPVDGREVLERLARVPVTTWNYKAQDDSIRHMGPMAQDFYAAFGLGLGDTTIDTIDSDGVALAAIQALHERGAELAQLASARAAELAELRGEVAALKAALR